MWIRARDERDTTDSRRETRREPTRHRDHRPSPGAVTAALAWLLVASVGVIAACDPEVDPSFATPEATLRSLLRSHRLDAVAPDVLRDRIARRERLRVHDQALLRSCFTTFRDVPEDQGLAGFVVGAIGRSRDAWRTVIHDERRATVHAGSRTRIELVRHADRTWRIDLHRSVPIAVQRQMAELSLRVRQRYAHDGLPTE